MVRQNVPSLPVTPRPFGLYSAAVVIENTDPHEAMGVQYEPEACGARVHTTLAACQADDRPLGTVSISVDNTSLGTVTAADVPDGSYTIDWGEGDPAAGTPLNGATHDYTAPGVYTVVITGPDGWTAAGQVTVTADTATGPFALDVGYMKVAETGVPIVTADPIALYHLFKCNRVGRDDFRARAEASMRLGESAAVEEAYEAETLPTAVNLTPAGGAVDVRDAVAILERYAAKNYRGVPTIHLPVDAAVLGIARDVVEAKADRLFTVLSSPVAAGAGYGSAIGPGAVTAGPGEAWAFVTGAVMVRRAPAEITETLALSPASNEFSALVERVVTVSHECIAAAVLVTVPEDPA